MIGMHPLAPTHKRIATQGLSYRRPGFTRALQPLQAAIALVL
jgi:hypothetical protein